MRKLDLKVGYSCNNLCKHCVQGNKRYKLKNKTTEEIFKDLEEAISKGIADVVFTGGEATIRKDIVDCIAHASELGFKSIQVQTNGRRFSSKKFTDAMVSAGMNEFAPALNGHIPELHDYLSEVSGAWKQTVAGIKNVREYEDLQIITNTVVTKPNYRFLKQIAQLLVGLGVNQYQLAFVHPAGSAWVSFDSIVPYVSMAAPFIHKGLQVGIDAGVSVMAEAMPLCHMKGYEKYVSEFNMPATDVYESGFRTEKWEEWRVTEGKMKVESCKTCAFFEVCEGPWREYIDKRGSFELIPVEGPKISPEDFKSL